MHPIFVFAFSIVWLALFTFMLGGVSSAPWVPTRRRERASVVDAVSVRRGAVVYDLGCGDGAMLFDLADRYPDARYIGYEIALLPWAIGLARKFAAGKRYANVSLRYGDLFGKDLADADLVFVFLLEKAYARLVEKFRSELKRDSTVVVEAWALPGAAHERIIRDGEKTLPMYQYSGAAIAASTPTPSL